MIRFSFLFLCLSFWSGLSISIQAQESDVIALVDSTSVSVDDEDSYTYYQHRELLLTDSRADDMAEVVLYMRSKDELLSFEYQIFDLEGNLLRTLKKRDLQRSEYSRDLGTDSYRLIAEVAPARFPVLIKYSIKRNCSRNILSYPTFIPQERRDMAVKHAVYQISWPVDKVQMRQKAVNLPLQTPKVEKGTAILTYAVDNLKAIPSAKYSVPLAEVTPAVMFAPERFTYFGLHGTINDWQSLGQWYNTLTGGCNIMAEKSEQELANAIVPCQNNLEKIKALYDLMGRQTRYVSLQLGIGGYLPASAASVYSMGYGDCKGLSNYMRTMLQAVGIKSNLVLVDTDNSSIIKDYAHLGQFNHMILEVFLPQAEGVDTLWLECTNSELPAGYIHTGISGHDAVELSDQGGRLIRIPEYADTLNCEHTDIRINLCANASADVSIDTREEYHCYSNHSSYLSAKEQDQRTRLLGMYNLPGAQAGEIWLKDLSVMGGKPCIGTHIDASIPKYANSTGRRLFVPVNPSRYPAFLSMEPGTTNEKMYLKYGFREETSIQLNIPEIFSVEALPKNIHIEENFASFDQSVECVGTQIIVTQRLDIRSGTYSAEARARMTEMQKTVSKAYAAKIVLLRK